MNEKRTVSKEDRLTATVWRPAILLWTLLLGLFVAIYHVGRFAVVNEIQRHADGLASTVAAGFSAEDMDIVLSEGARSHPVFAMLQQRLDHLLQADADIASIYVIRRSRKPFSSVNAYEYVFDESARGRNGDGAISADEGGKQTGDAFDASKAPALGGAARSAKTDFETISAYAPILRKGGESAAFVGVDIARQTIRGKMRLLRWVFTAFFLLTGALAHVALTYAVHALRVRAHERKCLRDLAARHEIVRRAAHAIPPSTGQMPDGPQMIIQRYDLSVAVAGGGIFRLFQLDQDRAAFCLADLSTSGVEESLLEGFLDLFQARVSSHSLDTSSALLPYADPGRPEKVIALLNELLTDELPPGASIPLAYGVLLFDRARVRVIAAGGALPLRFPVDDSKPAEIGCVAPPIGTPDMVFQGESESPLLDGEILALGVTLESASAMGANFSRNPLEMAKTMPGAAAVFIQIH